MLRYRRIWKLHAGILKFSSGVFAIGLVFVAVASLAMLVSSFHAEQALLAIGIVFVMAGLTSIILFMLLTALREFFGLRDQPERPTEEQDSWRQSRRRSKRQRKCIRRRAVWPATLVGVGESLVYPVAFMIGQTTFIGFWIGVKVAAQWSHWNDKPGEPITGRTRFYVFLLGNLLSIASGYGTNRLVRLVVG